MIWFLLITLAIGLLLFAVIAQSQGGSKKTKGRRSSNRVGGVDREFVARKWTSIELAVSGGGSLRDAVSEADKLVDYALKQSGTRGDTMGERLKNSRGRFSDIDAIWRAHKLRNALAHEADFDLVPSQAKEAIRDLGKGLKDLGAL